MTTWASLINLTFRDSGVLGVGQTLQAQDTADAAQRLRMMLAQWQRRRWLVFNLVDRVAAMNGSLFYTLGVGGTINAPRTDKIESAFMRQSVQSQPTQVDYPLRIINSYEEYSRITLKGMQAGPSWVLFFDSGYPLGKLYPWPLAGGAGGGSGPFELHVQVKNDLDAPVANDLAAEILLPPEYEEAIYAEMMKRTRSAYRLPPDAMINALAKSTLATIRSSNFAVPTLNLPASVQGRGGYSIWSDSWGPSGR